MGSYGVYQVTARQGGALFPKVIADPCLNALSPGWSRWDHTVYQVLYSLSMYCRSCLSECLISGVVQVGSYGVYQVTARQGAVD